MPDPREHSRIVRPLLGSFSITIPFYEPVTPEVLFYYREAITSAFNDAPGEIFEKRYIFNRPVQTHTIVTNVTIGSIELDVLYQAIVTLPWSDFCDSAAQCIKVGIHWLEELGSVAAGFATLHQMQSWIRKRLRKAPQKILSEKQDIAVRQTSGLEIEAEPIESIESIEVIRERLFGRKEPTCVGTVLNNPAAAEKVFHVTYHETDVPKHLGGIIVARDLNYYANGVRSYEDLRPGDVFFFNNPAALGLQQRTGTDSLYVAAENEDPDIDLLLVRLRTHEAPDVTPPTRRARRPVDADDLEDV